MDWQQMALGATCLIALIACCAYTWRIIHTRWRHGFLLPARRRGPVPWHPLDFPCLLGLHLVLMGSAVALFRQTGWLSGVELPPTPPGPTPHPVVQVFLAPGLLPLKFLATLVAAILAPVVEELLIRLLLQDWLEGRLRRTLAVFWSREVNESRAKVKRQAGVLSWLLTAAFFAALHFRTREPENLDGLLALAASGLVLPVQLVLILVLLATRTGRWRRRLWGHCKLVNRDFRIGLSAFFAVTPVVMALQFACLTLVQWLPQAYQFAPDPIPLFCLALVLGYLAQRQRRLTSCVTLHVLFNGLTLLILFGSGLVAPDRP